MVMEGKGVNPITLKKKKIDEKMKLQNYQSVLSN